MRARACACEGVCDEDLRPCFSYFKFDRATYPSLHLSLLPLELGRTLVAHNNLLPLRIQFLHGLLRLRHVMMVAQVVRNVLCRLQKVVVRRKALRLGQRRVHVLQLDVLKILDVVGADVDLTVDLAAVEALLFIVGPAPVLGARRASRHGTVVENRVYAGAAAEGWGGEGWKLECMQS